MYSYKLSADIQYYDLNNIEKNLEEITVVSCIVILLFNIEFLKIIYYFSGRYKVIFDSISIYLNKIVSFSFSVTLPFLLVSSLYTYFLFGGYIANYYKNYAFHIIKIFTSTYRGNLDNKDYDYLLTRYSFINNKKLILNYGYDSNVNNIKQGYKINYVFFNLLNYIETIINIIVLLQIQIIHI